MYADTSLDLGDAHVHCKASVCGIVYNLLQASPLVAPALWGVFFITGHSIQIYRILMDKVEVQMTGAESDLYVLYSQLHPQSRIPNRDNVTWH